MGRKSNDTITDTGANLEQTLSEGNQCIAWGLGIGGFGAATALAVGATCPLCIVVAPGLIGAGLLKRRKALRAASQSADDTLGSPQKHGV